MKKTIKTTSITLLLIVILFVSLMWFLSIASSHKIEIKAHFINSTIILTASALIISISSTWTILKDWFIFLLIEIILIFGYYYYQPFCEPCLPDTYCPPCISREQNILKFSGLLLFAIFIVWKIIVLFKKSYSK